MTLHTHHWGMWHPSGQDDRWERHCVSCSATEHERTNSMDDMIVVEGVPRGYITGLGRDYPHPRIAHLYEGPFHDPGRPLCRHGWNRYDGQSYSIWRNIVGTAGICKICMKRAKAGLPGVEPTGSKE